MTELQIIFFLSKNVVHWKGVWGILSFVYWGKHPPPLSIPVPSCQHTVPKEVTVSPYCARPTFHPSHVALLPLFPSLPLSYCSCYRTGLDLSLNAQSPKRQIKKANTVILLWFSLTDLSGEEDRVNQNSSCTLSSEVSSTDVIYFRGFRCLMFICFLCHRLGSAAEQAVENPPSLLHFSEWLTPLRVR